MHIASSAARRVDAVRAWVAAFRVYVIVRRNDRVSLCDGVVAAVYRARARIPASVEISTTARPQVRARARPPYSVIRPSAAS